MKLNSSHAWYIPGNVVLASILTVAVLFALTVFARARQAPAGPGAAALNVAKKEFIEEWVYRVQYGHEDEWFRIFKKYQLAILERQKQLGFVKQYTVWAPGLHASEESRWDYRVIIVRTSYEAPPGQSEDEIAKQLFPDQVAFKQEESRRWELTANHWDLPIHLVDPDAAE
ncbi:MAG: hypothetical protein ABSE96_11515 [Terracidiphilus sp.]|jgi:hypothetical protein